MDSRRRRLLRQKYLKEEEKLGKMSRGLSYDNDENNISDNDDYSMEDKERETSRFAPRVPKYKARTFKNILRDFDDPDFDERQNYVQDYQREEIVQETQNEPEEFTEQVQKTTTATVVDEPKDEAISDEVPYTRNEEEIKDETDEDDYLDDYNLATNETNDEDDTPDLPQDYQPQPVRRRKTLRQMESEALRRQAKGSEINGRRSNYNPYNGLQKTKTPRPIRWLAFSAFIMLAFFGGYYLCGGVLNLLHIQPGSNEQIELPADDSSLLTQNNTTQTTPNGTAATTTNSGDTKSLTVFVPKGGSLVSVSVEQKAVSSNEQMLKSILSVFLDNVKEVGLLSTSTDLTELWIAGDTVYLSMNKNFVSDLHRLNTTSATILMRGFLRTMNANMSSIKKLKVFVESQEITDTKPIDLTATWETM